MGPQNLINEITRKYGKRLANVIVASEKPFSIGEVVPFAGVRFRVDRELTRDEFEREAKANFESRKKDGLGDERHFGTSAIVEASRTHSDAWADEIPTNAKHYYALERLL